MHGWLHCGNEAVLRRLCELRQPRVIVELGESTGRAFAGGRKGGRERISRGAGERMGEDGDWDD